MATTHHSVITDLSSLTLHEMETFFEAHQEKSYRAAQVFQWIHQRFATDFSSMSNLPKSLRMWLAESCTLTAAKTIRKATANDAPHASCEDVRGVSRKEISNAPRNETAKYLFELANNTIIESVLMKYNYGNAVCVSSQAGCAMGCLFCASGADGLERNLTAGEMCAQVYEIQKDAGKVHSVVIMGSGEPLANFDNTLRFIRIINAPEGLGLGQRHITLSTCGLPDKIRELAAHRLQLTLAVSLHAPNDQIRQSIMPIARRYPIEQIIAACADYAQKTGRRVTYEYALMAGVNDGTASARELGKRLKRMLCHVNLIPVNAVEGGAFRRSGKAAIEAFASVLRDMGIETTIRRELGSDVNAACGQLRSYHKP